jgi:hypothetical protein
MRRVPLPLLLGIVLAVVGALIAAWLTNTMFWWVGAIIGGPTGAFAPSLLDWQKGRVEAREKVSRLAEVRSSSPAALLDPQRQIIGFTGRKQELADLLAWCRAEKPEVSARLISGPAGVGKSRLALELRAELGSNWTCVQVADGQEAEAVTAVRATTPGRVLLVVDSAETRADLAPLLGDAAPAEAVNHESATRRRAALNRTRSGENWGRSH